MIAGIRAWFGHRFNIRWIPNDNIEALFWGSQILSTSIQQEIKNVQNEYTIIIAESGLYASYDDNFQKTIFNLF